MGVGLGAGGRRGDVGSPGGGRDRARLPGGACCCRPNAGRRDPSPRCDPWLGGGRVHASHLEGGRPPAAHPLPGAERRATRADGRCVALAARPLFVWARAAGSIYQAELQRALSLRLGVEWGRTGPTPASWTGSRRPSCGRSRNGRLRSRPSWKPGRPLRVAGVADAGRRRGVAGHSAGQGPLAHPDPARWSLAGRGRSRRPGGGPGLDRRVCWRDPALPDLTYEEIVRCWSTKTSACALIHRGSTNRTSSSTSLPCRPGGSPLRRSATSPSASSTRMQSCG